MKKKTENVTWTETTTTRSPQKTVARRSSRDNIVGQADPDKNKSKCLVRVLLPPHEAFLDLLRLAPALPRRDPLYPGVSQGLLEEGHVAGGQMGAVEAELRPEGGARVVQELVEEVEPVQVLGLVHQAPENAVEGLAGDEWKRIATLAMTTMHKAGRNDVFKCEGGHKST